MQYREGYSVACKVMIRHGYRWRRTLEGVEQGNKVIRLVCQRHSSSRCVGDGL